MCLLCLGSDPPESVKGKGGRADQFNKLLTLKDQPSEFAVGMKDACFKEPCCCLGAFLCVPTGVTACWARKKVLDTYHSGLSDYTCCQNYLTSTCCCCGVPKDCCKGNGCALCIEGLCCPVFGVSVARMHLMETKLIRPDPCDYQIIHCSNLLQCASCICTSAASILACVWNNPASDALAAFACIFDVLVDMCTCWVTGCMAAQIAHEVHVEAATKGPVVTQGPVAEGMIRA